MEVQKIKYLDWDCDCGGQLTIYENKVELAEVGHEDYNFIGDFFTEDEAIEYWNNNFR